MSIKVTTISKIEKYPGTDKEVILFEFAVEGITIKGKQMDKWFYDAKIDGKKYMKVYLDLEAGIILGKKSELSRWEQVAKIDSREVIRL